MNLDLAKEAFLLMREASFQSHNGHWDMTMQGGKGCPECIRSRGLRKEADRLWEEATKDGEVPVQLPL